MDLRSQLLDAIYDGGIDIMRIIRQLFAVCTRVYGEYISGIFCILDDSVRLEYSMVPLSMLQFYNILHLQNILRIPYIRNIPWLFHVSNILLVISSFYIKEILFFFSYFSFITSWRIFWRTLLSFLCFLKLISFLYVSCYYCNAKSKFYSQIFHVYPLKKIHRVQNSSSSRLK